jgi:putative flippase GtrA
MRARAIRSAAEEPGRPLVERSWRYSLVGLLCAMSNYVIILAVDVAGGHYLLGVLMAFLAITPVAYLLHSQFTFAEPLRLRAFWRFAGGVASAYPIAVIMMIVLCSGLGLSVAVAVPIATVALFVWNFAAAHWAIVPRFAFRSAIAPARLGAAARQPARGED